MLRVQVEVAIKRPVDDVYQYLADPANWVNWLEGFVQSRQEGAMPLKVGSKLHQAVRFLGRRFDIDSEVTELVHDATIGVRVVSGPFPMAWRHLVATSGGGTRMTTVLEAEPGSYFKVAGPLLKPMLQRHLGDDHKRLKTLLENPDKATPLPADKSTAGRSYS